MWRDRIFPGSCMACFFWFSAFKIVNFREGGLVGLGWSALVAQVPCAWCDPHQDLSNRNLFPSFFSRNFSWVKMTLIDTYIATLSLRVYWQSWLRQREKKLRGWTANPSQDDSQCNLLWTCLLWTLQTSDEVQSLHNVWMIGTQYSIDRWTAYIKLVVFFSFLFFFLHRLSYGYVLLGQE